MNENHTQNNSAPQENQRATIHTMQDDLRGLPERDSQSGMRGPTPPAATLIEQEIPVDTKADDRSANSSSTENRRAAIRTFHSDAAESIQKKKTSLTSIVLAEKKRQTDQFPSETSESTHSGKRLGVFALSFGLLILAFGVLGAVYYFGLVQEAPVSEEVVNTKITVDKIVFFNIVGVDLSLFQNTLNALSVSTGSGVGDLTAFIPTETKQGDGGEIEERMTASGFLNALGVEGDAALLRSIEDRFLLFGYNRGVTDYGFIFDISFFDNAFAGMLRWEETIANNLSFLTKNTLTPSQELPTADIATATPIFLDAGVFVDDIIDNKDVRVLRNKDGAIVLMYSFPDTRTLVIVDNEETFRTILDRLTRVEFRQ